MSEREHTSDAIRRRFDELAAALHAAGKEFCVARNRERIPAGLVERGDIDLIISPTCGERELLRIVAPLRPVHLVARQYVFSVYFKAGDRFLHIDLVNRNQQWRGARYRANRDIVGAASLIDGVPTAALADQALLVWLSGLIWGGFFNVRYQSLIEHAIEVDRAGVETRLRAALGQALAQRFIALAARGEAARTATYIGEARRSLWLRGLREYPVETISGAGAHYMRETQLRLDPPGVVIAVRDDVVAELMRSPQPPSANTYPFTRILMLDTTLRPFSIEGRPQDPLSRPAGRWAAAVQLRHQLAKNVLVIAAASAVQALGRLLPAAQLPAFQPKTVDELIQVACEAAQARVARVLSSAM